ncbi:MAG: L-threonylcarbamoyladenylate synthase [Bacteroidota bacterium]|nr:L-threonylcarbamoyladenylate synthase [Bacteroidota bacterium]
MLLNASFISEIDEEINKTAQMLREGKIIVYPTDTIWGIGCTVSSVNSVLRIRDIKKRSDDKYFILLVSDIAMLKQYTMTIHPRIENLLSIHERPLTIIYPLAQNVSELLLPKNKSIGIRICKDLFCQALIQQTGEALIATSANISGFPSPSHFGEITNEILQSVDYVCQYKRMDKSPQSPSVMANYNEDGELNFIR